MTSRIIFISCFVVAVGYSLCWYPLQYLKAMQIGSPQLLFYAFSSASLCTIPWLALQVKEWRGHTESLLAVGLSGAVMLTFLNFSLLSGDPLSAISIFCLVIAIILLLKRALSQQSLIITEFMALLVVIVVSLVILFGLDDKLSFHWTQLTSALAGIACYLFFRYHGSSPAIPLTSKLSAIFICSTWLVGMVMIFSPRLVSFPQENAVLISVLYGVLCLIPILLSMLRIFLKQQEMNMQLWSMLVLSVAILSVGLFRHTLFDTPELGAIIVLVVFAGILGTKIES